MLNKMGAAVVGMIAVGTLLLCALTTPRNAIVVLEQSENPFELRRVQESQEYDRYLLHEVMEDGNRPHARSIAKHQVKQDRRAAVTPHADQMTAAEAAADFNAYFSNQAAKAEREDIMRSTANRVRLVKSALGKQQLIARPDPRVSGTLGWDYSWHRAAGSGDLPQEKYSTDSWTAEQINNKVAHAVEHGGVPRSVQRTISSNKAAIAHRTPSTSKLPAMPGSFKSLEQQLH